MKLSDFDYSLDPSFIAQYPVPRRDHARLLVLDRKTGDMYHRYFYELVEYLNPGDLVILNDTRVFAARLHARKEGTGGQLNLLLIRPIHDGTWLALISGRYRIGQRILFGDNSAGEIVGEEQGGQVHVRFHIKTDFFHWLDRSGRTPLPPYIKRNHNCDQHEKDDRRAYQTVYARTTGSVAAPTAGLHFTQDLLKQVCEKGVGIHTVTLHVGPGTFRPVQVSRIENHSMDPEYVSIPHSTVAAIKEARQAGGRVFAVGTTTVRALESAASSDLTLNSLNGFTNLFIIPGYRFKVVDALVTNFHLPRSTLLMLVSALTGCDRLMAAYQEAMRQGYRFYSFGDAMLII